MHNAQGDWAVWLEDATGQRIPIRGSCSLGRSASNLVPLSDEKVSRRHAIIHAQEQNEFWLVDLGSRNGTYLNGRRIMQPTRLRSGDQIRVGQFAFTFQQIAAGASALPETLLTEKTIAEIRASPCWLMIADIVGSTVLIKTLPPDEVPVVVGGWLAECKQTVEECGGGINQFLGDGFFAYWHDRERSEVAVARALEALGRMQALARPAFRVVLHRGQVFTGGASLGEESLSGREMHFVFRMEKLAGTLQQARLLSEPAWARLAALIEAHELGRHGVAGFEGDYLFYGF